MVNWKVVGAIALLVNVVFASGCAAPEPESTDETPVADGPGAASGTGGQDGGNVTVDEGGNLTEVIPTVVLLLDGNVTEPVNGTFVVPADVEVTFDATNNTQLDAFVWTLGNETAEGSTFTSVFLEGNHTVTLDASGDNATGHLEIPVKAINATDGGPIMLGSTPISFASETKPLTNNCVTATQPVTFPEGTVTRHLTMTLDMSWTSYAFNVEFKVQLRDAAGAVVAGASRASGSADLVLEKDDLELPGGEYTAYGEFCALAAVNASFTVEGQADHLSA